MNDISSFFCLVGIETRDNVRGKYVYVEVLSFCFKDFKDVVYGFNKREKCKLFEMKYELMIRRKMLMKL